MIQCWCRPAWEVSLPPRAGRQCNLSPLLLLGKGESLESGILHTHKSILVAVFSQASLSGPLQRPGDSCFLRGSHEGGGRALPSGCGSGETVASLGFPFLSGLHLWQHSVASMDEPLCPVCKTGEYICAWGRWEIPQD